MMKHRDVEYGVEEDVPGKWRWLIYPKIEAGPKVIGEAKYLSREAAVDGAIEEINNGFERSRLAPRPRASGALASRESAPIGRHLTARKSRTHQRPS